MMEDPLLTEVHNSNFEFSVNENKRFVQFIACALATIFMMLVWSTSNG